MSIMIPILLATALFIIEGAGNIFPRNLILYLYISLLAPLVLYVLIKKKSISFPFLPSIFFGLFLIFSLISSFFYSVDKQVSFEWTLFYMTGYLIFIFFYNHKDLGKKYFNTIIIAGSLIFTTIYLFNLVYGKNPANEYQLVTSYFQNSHNHLGDFLGLGLVTFFYWLLNNSKKRLSDWLVIFFPFFLLSFSRSAFFALIVVYLVILVKSKINHLFTLKSIFGLILIASTMIFFFSTVSEVKGRGVVGRINQYLTSRFNLKSKEFTAGRIAYLKQGLASVSQHPLFGVGPGNFGFLSNKYVSTGSPWYDFQSTDTAHSLFPEILFENGTLAVVFFAAFIFLIVIHIFKRNQLESYLALYLLTNFQTDYTYRIYSMFILFMILSAVVYEEKETNRGNNGIVYALFSAVLLIIVEFILASQIFLRLNQPDLGLTFYPLNKEAYRQIIIQETAQKGCQGAEKFAKNYYFVSSGYLPTLQLLSNYYEVCGNKKMAIYMLDKAVEDNRFINFDIVKKDYSLKKEVYGKKTAKVFLSQVIQGYGNLRYLPFFSKQVVDFCRKNNDDICGKMGWSSSL